MAGLATGDFPQMSNCAHTHSTYDGGMNILGLVGVAQATAGMGQLFRGAAQQGGVNTSIIHAAMQQAQELNVANPKRRLIKVIIADPDEKVPLDKCLLYSSEEKLTDLNDQELFFEIDIKSILDKHNADRVKIVDKTIKERREVLEPVKVRDLRMVIVTVATF